MYLWKWIKMDTHIFDIVSIETSNWTIAPIIHSFITLGIHSSGSTFSKVNTTQRMFNINGWWLFRFPLETGDTILENIFNNNNYVASTFKEKSWATISYIDL